MTTRVKICGLKTPAALDAALAGKADYVGFVFYPPSPRDIAVADAAVLADSARGHARIVALMVDPDDAALADVMATLKPDILQLHGSESPDRIAEIKRRYRIPVMKAIKVGTAADAGAALAYEGYADLILFDAKAPKTLSGALPGGNGLSFDWGLLDGVKDRVDYMLSGGLTPENVVAAIHATGATAVDVSSGVERAPGDKDPALIAAFLAAAKSA